MSTVVHTYTADDTYTASPYLYYGTTDDNGNPAATVHADVRGAVGGSGIYLGYGAWVSGDIPATTALVLDIYVGDAHDGGAGDGSGTAGGGSSAVVDDTTGLLYIEAGGGGGTGSRGFSGANSGGNADIGNGADDGQDVDGDDGAGKGANGTTPGEPGAGRQYTGSPGTSFAGSYGSVAGGAATTSSEAGGGGGGAAGGGSGGGGPTGGGGGGGGSSLVDPSVLNPVMALNSAGVLTAGPTNVVITEVIVDAPLAPTLVLPTANAFVDINLATTFQWDYEAPDTDGGYAAYALWVLADDASIDGYWDGTDFSSPTPVWMPDTGGAVTIPEGIFATHGIRYTWNVATQEGSYNQEGPASASQYFFPSEGPVSTLVAPTGTISDAQPVIQFTIQLDDQSVLEEYQVCIYTPLQTTIPGFTPGVSPAIWDSGPKDGGNAVNGDTIYEYGLANSNIVLPDGSFYYLFILLVETGSVEGPWNNTVGFTESYSAPSAPTIDVSNQIEPTTQLPYNRIIVNRSESTANVALVVQYSDDGGVTWLNVRGFDFADESGHASITVPDYEAYPNTERLYQAFIVDTTDGVGAYLASATSAQVGCTNVVPDWWLIDCETMAAGPVVGAAMPLNVMSDSLPAVISEIQGQHNVLGADYITIIRDAIEGADITFQVDFLDQPTYNTFIALRKLQKTLLMQAPYISQWYMAFDSDLTPTVTNAAGVYQQVGFGLLEQARP